MAGPSLLVITIPVVCSRFKVDVIILLRVKAKQKGAIWYHKLLVFFEDYIVLVELCSVLLKWGRYGGL